MSESLPVAPDAVVDFVEVEANSGAAIQITREQWHVLTAVDGFSSLRTIAHLLQAHEPMVLHLAAELVANGVVMVVGHSAAG
jgi:hypothetical protein